MQYKNDKINEYVDCIAGLVRWKKARPGIANELRDHIIDQRDALLSKGLSKEEATDRAIKETGDPAEIGLRLDRQHRPEPQLGMLGLTAVLVIIGILLRITLLDYDYPLPRQIFAVFIGLGAMTAAYFLDFTIIGKYLKVVYIFACAVVLFLTFFAPLGSRGFYYGLTYIGLAFPVAYAIIVYAMRGKGYIGIIFCGLAYLIPSIAFFTRISSLISFTLAALVILSAAIYKKWFGERTGRAGGFILVYGSVLAVIVFFFNWAANRSGYLQNRLHMVFNPWTDPMGLGFTGTTIRGALEGAKFFGAAEPSQNVTQFFDVFSSNGDFMITTVILRLGWGVFFLIMAVLVFFFIKSLRLCLKQNSGLGRFISLAVLMTFVIQAVYYVVFNLGYAVLSPVSLPFLSYGNTALVINLGLAGLMMSVFRTGSECRDKDIVKSTGGIITWHDGKLTVDIKSLIAKEGPDDKYHNNTALQQGSKLL